MRTLAFLLGAVVWFGGIRPAADDGRRGNRFLEAGDAESAELAFLNGLRRDDVPTPFLARLQHNLGLAKARLENAPAADSAFAAALSLAASPSDRARYAYNAGTAALINGEAALAVQHLRRSLVLDPNQASTRRNLELALRSIEESKDPEKPEPSEFAKQLKERADALVDQRLYPDALELMNDGLTQDSTVAAYGDFISRLSGVVNIENQLPEPAQPDSLVPNRLTN